jgi:hypothetical protein
VKLLKRVEPKRAQQWIGALAIVLTFVLVLFPSVFREATQSALPTASQAEPWKVGLVSWLGLGGTFLLMITSGPESVGGKFRQAVQKAARTTIFVACVMGVVVGSIILLIWWIPRLIG